MIDLLIHSDRDITLLTCEECAIDVYVELVNRGCRFLQSEKRIVEEIAKSNGVVEITKLVAESNKNDVFFVLGMENESSLIDRDVFIDCCVEEFIDEDSIPESSEVFMVDCDCDDSEFEEFMSDIVDTLIDKEMKELKETEEDCLCDECLSVLEIIKEDDLSLEESLREAYRCGRQAALYEIVEEIQSKIFE